MQIVAGPEAAPLTETEEPMVALRPSLDASWALLCGFLASGALRWQNIDGLRLLAAWLMGDVLMGFVLAQGVHFRRSALTAIPSLRGSLHASGPTLPYVAHDAPGQRIVQQVARWVEGWRSPAWRRAHWYGTSGVLGMAVVLVLAASLGSQAVLVMAIVLALSFLVGLLAGRNEALLVRSSHALHVIAAWLLGSLVFGPLGYASLGLAVLFGLSAYSRARWQTGRESVSLWPLGAIYGILVTILLIARQPLLAVMVAVAAFVERMSFDAGEHVGRTPANPGWLGRMLSMLLAALAVAHWA
ncbi:MAG: hypothetical protein ACYC4R_14750 [Anaerolineae bacterium]